MTKNTNHQSGITELNFVDICRTLWNKMSVEQRINFLKKSDLDMITDESKLWFELDEVQQYAIVKWMIARIGVYENG